MENKKVELGDEVQDTITGFKGIVVGITRWIAGCDRAMVAPKVDKDGKMGDSNSFDVPLLKILKKLKIVKEKDSEKTGGGFPKAKVEQRLNIKRF